MIASILIRFSFLRGNQFDGRSVQVRLVKGAQFEDAVALRIPDEAKYGQAVGKCLLKLAAVLKLNGEGALPAGFSSLPLVDGGRDENPLLWSMCGYRAAVKNGLNSGRIEMPLGQKPVRRQPTLQSR
jgi:hypothetical protein